jgi:hypothetical protein
MVAHEKTHGDQWAMLGPDGIAAAWVGGAIGSAITGNYKSGGGGCANILEFTAGEAGGYALCNW